MVEIGNVARDPAAVEAEHHLLQTAHLQPRQRTGLLVAQRRVEGDGASLQHAERRSDNHGATAHSLAPGKRERHARAISRYMGHRAAESDAGAVGNLPHQLRVAALDEAIIAAEALIPVERCERACIGCASELEFVGVA